MSPTARTLKELRKRGYVAQVVEHWNAFSQRRVDLFQVIDVVYLADGYVGGIQATSGSCVSARIHKIEASEHLPALRKANLKLSVWGWRKNAKGRYVLREIDLS